MDVRGSAIRSWDFPDRFYVVPLNFGSLTRVLIGEHLWLRTTAHIWNKEFLRMPGRPDAQDCGECQRLVDEHFRDKRSWELNNIGVFCNCRAEWGKRSLWSSTSFSWNTVTASKSRVDTSVVAWISSRDCGSRKKAEVCKSVVLVSCRQSKYVVNYERLQKCLNAPDQTCWNEIELKKRSGQKLVAKF